MEFYSKIEPLEDAEELLKDFSVLYFMQQQTQKTSLWGNN